MMRYMYTCQVCFFEDCSKKQVFFIIKLIFLFAKLIFEFFYKIHKKYCKTNLFVVK